MATAIRTRVYKLHHDPETSSGIGYLDSWQRFVRNAAVDILNQNPDIPLWGQPGKDSSCSLLNRLEGVFKQHKRASVPLALLKAGAQQVWRGNDLRRRQRELLREHLEGESDQKAGQTQLAKRLRHYSRKRGTSTVVSVQPPVRLDENTFTIKGARYIVFRTKKPVPESLDIRSFKLVEVQRQKRGAGGALRNRRYALHLDIAVEIPEPAPVESVETYDEVMGVAEGENGEISFSNGKSIITGDAETGRKESKALSAAARKKRGSKRRKKMTQKVRRLRNKREANERRRVLRECRSLFQTNRPTVIALEPRVFDARIRPTAKYRSESSARGGHLIEPKWSSRMLTIVDEAQRQGIRVYTLLPQREEFSECWHRSDRENQVDTRCLCRGRREKSRVLQYRAIKSIEMSTDRSIADPHGQEGRRVKPSRDTHSADKPRSDDREAIRRSPLEAGPPSGRQGAGRQLTLSWSGKYIITDELLAIIQMIPRADIAKSTMRTYAQNLAQWASWAMVNGYNVIPAKPEELGLYLAFVVEKGHGAANIGARAAVISKCHEILGLQDPQTDYVRKVIRGIRNIYGDSVKQARPLTGEHLEAIKDTAFVSIGKETPEETWLRASKTIALIYLMKDGLLRGAEASKLTWSDVTEFPDGTGAVLIRKSKTDQFGKGRTVPISAETMKLLSAVRRGAAGQESLFGWSGNMIRERIRQAGEMAGLGSSFTSHSVRRGTAQELVQKGVTLEVLLEAGGWKSPAVAMHYVADDHPQENAVTRFYRRNVSQ